MPRDSFDAANTDREFALPPGQFAYTQDTGKGTINVYVGPNVVQLSGQEQSVVFNAQTRTFKESQLIRAIQIVTGKLPRR